MQPGSISQKWTPRYIVSIYLNKSWTEQGIKKLQAYLVTLKYSLFVSHWNCVCLLRTIFKIFRWHQVVSCCTAIYSELLYTATSTVDTEIPVFNNRALYTRYRRLVKMSLLCEYPDFIYLAYCVDKKNCSNTKK